MPKRKSAKKKLGGRKIAGRKKASRKTKPIHRRRTQSRAASESSAQIHQGVGDETAQSERTSEIPADKTEYGGES
jgi:hypothetical protein